MEWRKVEGEERDKVLGNRKPSGFNYQQYLDVLDNATDGELIAVKVAKGQERGEKIRFSRAASQRGKSLTWYTTTNANEITFQVGPRKTQRARTRKAAQS